MWIARQAEFDPAEVRKILLGIKRDMHRRKVNIAPGALNRMRRGKARGAAHGDERIDSADA